MTLWDTLVELDDLTASTNSIMMLLAGILACPSVSMETISEAGSLSVLVPRLWPFLRHTIKSVRSAALKTLQTLLISNRTEDAALSQQVLSQNGSLNAMFFVNVKCFEL